MTHVIKLKKLFIFFLIIYDFNLNAQIIEKDTIYILFKNNEMFENNFSEKNYTDGVVTYIFNIFPLNTSEIVRLNFKIEEKTNLKYKKLLRKNVQFYDLKWFSNINIHDFYKGLFNNAIFYIIDNKRKIYKVQFEKTITIE